MKAAIFRLVLAFITFLSMGYWIESKTFDSLWFASTMVLGIASLFEFITYIENCNSYYEQSVHYRKGIISRFFIK